MESGTFIKAIGNPPVYKFPAEDAEYTVTTETPTLGSDGFVKVPAGEFKRAQYRGATAYTIKLTKDLYVCDHEVTQGEWEQYMTYYGNAVGGTEWGQKDSSYPYAPKQYLGEGENYPVYFVNWYEAVIYCNLLSIAEDKDPVYYLELETNTNPANWLESDTLHTNIKKTAGANGKYYYDGTSSNSVLDDATKGIKMNLSANGYRLPTDAEWIYAALGSYSKSDNWNGYNDSSVFAGYDGTNEDCLEAYAWYGDRLRALSHEIKAKLPNSYGLYDMSGNVNEWCYDWYGNYANSDEINPTGPEGNGSMRRYHGGSSGNIDLGCMVSVSNGDRPSVRNIGIGFRLVRSGPSSEN